MSTPPPTDHQHLSGGRLPLFSFGRRGVLRSLVAILLALVVAEAGARLIERSMTAPALLWYDEAAQLRVEMMEARQADVVFAGTSMSQQAFVPSVFDTVAGQQQSFNVALPGAVPQVMGPWLDQVVVDGLQPSTVVWGLSSLDFSSSYGDGPTDAWRSAPETRTDVLGQIDAALADHSALIRNRSLLRRPSEVWGEAADRRAQQFDRERSITGPDGERRGFDSERSPEGEAINRARLADLSVDQDDVDAVEAAVSALTEAGIDVVLVELPVPPAFIELHPNGSADHDAVGETIRQLAGRLGVGHVPLDRSWSDADFVDFTHLDAEGATAFTTLVATTLLTTEPAELIPTGDFEPAPPADSSAASDDAECQREVIIDEYGFEVEISNCPSSDDDQQVAVTFPNRNVESAFDVAIAAARAAAEVCADPVAWRSQMAEASAVTRQLAIAAEALAPDNEWRTSVGPQSMVDAVRVELLTQSTCDALPHAGEAATQEAMSSAVTSLHLLAVAFEDPGRQTGGPFWFRTAQIGHIRAIRDLEASGQSIEVITIGSSTVHRGFDAETLTDASGSVTFNAGVGALSPSVAGPWLRDVIETGTTPSTVVVGFTTIESVVRCNNARRTVLASVLEARANTARLGIDVTDLSLEKDDPYQARYDQQITSLGTTNDVLGADPTRAAEEAAGYLDRFGSDVCADVIEAFRSVVSAVQESLPGARIIVVDMPTHPLLMAAHPDGQAIFDRASQHAEDVAVDLGADYLDARDFLEADQFADVLHANESGRQLLTESLLDVLER